MSLRVEFLWGTEKKTTVLWHNLIKCGSIPVGMDFKSKPIIFTSLIVAVAIVAAGFWHWQNKGFTPPVSQKQAGETERSEKVVDAGFGAQVLEKAQNPIKDKVPETNPFKAETNPFANTKTNPFQTEANPLKAQYKNPFE